mmetsp:Transcript_18437/g.25353  ORF Transcript_18437/g.25353 Transcript_18437/m.25353 type:complete len:203 (+) Transcript_18437:1141-1749(+)
MPTPLLSSGRMVTTCGRTLSSSDSASMAFRKTCSTTSFSSSLLKSMRAICSAYDSQSFLLKLKTMQGSSSRSITSFTTRRRSLLSCFVGFGGRLFLPEPVVVSSGTGCSRFMAFWKLSSRKRPCSSTTRYKPSAAAGNRKCCSGTGRYSVYTTWQGWWCSALTQPTNSLALGIVADRNTKRTLCGSRMMLSSHTTPRSLSRM